MAKIWGQMERAQLENVSVDPSGSGLTPEGRIVWNTVSDRIKVSDGAALQTVLLSGQVVNADVNASAAIAQSKMAALTASRAMQTDASGFASVGSVTSTELGYVSGVVSAIQTQLNGKLAGTATAKSADYTILDGDAIFSVLMTTAGVDRVVTLPTAADNNSRIISIKKVDSGSGKVTVDGEGAEAIDGALTFILSSQNDEIIVQSDGLNWNIIANHFANHSRIRVENGNGHGSTNTKIRRFSTAVLSVGSAISYSDSATLGAFFTINEPGIYTVEYAEDHTGADHTFGISRNSSQLTTNINAVGFTAADRLVHTQAKDGLTGFCSAVLRLSAGDIIRPHTQGVQTSTANGVAFAIAKINF